MVRWFVPFVMVGCAGTEPLDGGQYGEEGTRCEAVSRAPLAADEVSALGFAPQDLLALVGPPETVTLTWAEGGTTELALEVVADGAMELVDYELATEDGSEPAIDLGCADLVELEVTFSFATADGVLDESVATRLASADGLVASAWVDLDEPRGTFDAWDYAPAGNDWDDLRAWVAAEWSTAGASGVVEGQGSGTDGDVAFAEMLPIGSWGSAE